MKRAETDLNNWTPSALESRDTESVFLNLIFLPAGCHSSFLVLQFINLSVLPLIRCNSAYFTLPEYNAFSLANI